MEKMEHQKNIDNSKDEIDLLELVMHIWNGRKIIYKTTAIFIVIGLFVALGSKNIYKSEAKLLPEVSNKDGGVSGLMKQFGGLSSLAGIDLQNMNNSDAINPTLYPDIVKSTPFMIQLLNTSVKIPSLDTTTSLYIYMTSLTKKSLMDFVLKYSIGLPGTIIKMFRKDSKENIEISINESPIRINLEMSKTIESLKECIQSDVDLKSGIISISAEFQDPEVAAQVAEKTVLYLTQYVTEYRLQKVRENLKFVSEQCEIAKIEFNRAQMDRALFLDENKNIISAKIQSEKERLQSQYDLTYNIYNNLAQQKEQAKIKVQEETPVIKVLNPVQVPVEKSKPKRSMIMIEMIFLGGLLGLGIIFIKNKYLSQIKEFPKKNIQK